MPNSDSPADQEWSELLEAVSNRDLTPDQSQRLSERLTSDAAARHAFIEATAFDAMLASEFPAEEHDLSSALGVGMDRSESATATSANAWKRPLVIVLAAAASIMLLAFALRPRGESIVATIASSEEAAWESSLPTTPGSNLERGRLKLRSGIATIQFVSGANVTLEAPAELELISAMRGKLVEGAAIIHVPEEAQGFVMETPNGYAVDYGTQFAVQVDRKLSRSDFELIEGEISVHNRVNAQQVRLTDPHAVASVQQEQVIIVDEELKEEPEIDEKKIVRIGTEGQATSVLRNNKRHKFINPEVLSVKTTENGKWDYRSFFAFDLSSVEVDRIDAAKLRLNLVPSQKGFASRLPVVNRFGVYGITNSSRLDWNQDCLWEDAPSARDGKFLGSFEILRSQQRGSFGIENRNLVEFLKQNSGKRVTFLLIRETTQVDGQGPGLTHSFASHGHPEAVGPLLEMTIK
ncbi:MAG: iron dicitrate transport regulator FecR [Planctomycetota bacterium]